MPLAPSRIRVTDIQALDRQGRFQIERLGLPSDPAADVYHHLMAISWPRFIALLISTYFAINLVFGTLYWLVDGSIKGARPGSYMDAFFFSVQTLATIGYGELSPGSTYGHWVVSLEACAGTLGFALIAGLAFAKFSVPSARILFSRIMIVREQAGLQLLEFRLANARPNQLVDVKVKATLARNEMTSKGEVHRRLQPLVLLVSETPLFALSFVVTHVMDEHSPLNLLSSDPLDECNCEIIVTLTGIDDALGQAVYARTVYTRADIRWQHRFVSTLTMGDRGRLQLDLRNFHDAVPDKAQGLDT